MNFYIKNIPNLAQQSLHYCSRNYCIDCSRFHCSSFSRNHCTSCSCLHGIHYAEACAGFGAARLAGALKDPVLLKKLVQRYAIERTDTIPNSANHVDVNVYGILPLELYRVGMGTAFREQGMRLADGQWELRSTKPLLAYR